MALSVPVGFPTAWQQGFSSGLQVLLVSYNLVQKLAQSSPLYSQVKNDTVHRLKEREQTISHGRNVKKFVAIFKSVTLCLQSKLSDITWPCSPPNPAPQLQRPSTTICLSDTKFRIST